MFAISSGSLHESAEENPLVQLAASALHRWRTIFADHRRSGFTIAAFCLSRKIVKSGFHCWRNILEQLDQPRAEPFNEQFLNGRRVVS
jgi:hypothetical protein